MRRLTIGDRKVRVRDEGESDRCPFVLIHGAAASSVVWMDVVRRLAGRRRVIAPDLPGHGQSDPWHGISLDVYRDAVGTVCAHLGVARAVLVGHSMGGAVALACALAFPERVAGLVLVATGARAKVAPPIFDVVERHFERLPELMGEVAYSPSTPREIVERWTAVLVAAPREIALGDYRALDGFDVRPNLGALKMPSLVIGGADDLLVPPAIVRELAAGLPNARAALLEHAGHMPMHEQPDRFHAELDPFLAEVP